MEKYTITLSDGVTEFDIYDLEGNGPGNLSSPRLIQEISLTGGAGTNYFTVAGDMTYRFVPGFTFDVIGSAGTLNDGTYTVVPAGSTFAVGITTISVAEVIASNSIPLGLVSYSIPVVEEATSLLFSGRGQLNYGETLITNAVHMLEHFANDTSPVNPTPGQLWFKTDTEELLVRNTINAAWNPIAGGGGGGALGYHYSGTVTVPPTGTGEDAIVIGDGATTGIAFGAVAIGLSTTTIGSSAVSLGQNASAQQPFSLSIGAFSIADGTSSIALGQDANAGGTNAFAGGRFSNAGGNESVALGRNSNSAGLNSTTVGRNSSTPSQNATAYGSFSSAGGTASLALGTSADASGDNATVAGPFSTASGNDSIALGNASTASAINSTALGSTAVASDVNATAVGIGASAGGGNSVAVGNTANASGTASLSLGADSDATADFASAVGNTADASGVNSTAVGFSSIASAISATAVGHLVNNSVTQSFRAGFDGNVLHVRDSGRLYLEGPQAAYIAPSYATSSEPAAIAGAIIYDSTLDELRVFNGTIWETPGGGGGVTDHGALTGLADDDHTQYHNDARGDLRYSLLAHTHTSFAANITMNGNTISDVILRDIAEAVQDHPTPGATETIDLSVGTVHPIILDAPVVTLTFSNPVAAGSASSFTLIATQDGVGSRTITWPLSVKWAGGAAPTLTTTAASIDVLSFITTDGGVSWLGFAAGLDMI